MQSLNGSHHKGSSSIEGHRKPVNSGAS